MTAHASRAHLDKAPHEVAAMFDGVAERYDLTNDVLSLGQTRLWRRAVARAVDARPGQRVLDLAAGTGSSSLPFDAAGAHVVACRLLPRHAARGQAATTPPSTLIAGDALRLPFADGTFDAVTISFGLRNVSDVDAALREMARVTRPGGRLVVCEFSHPTWRPFRTVYSGYLMAALPKVARRVSVQPGRLRLPRRVHRRLARPGAARGAALRGRVGRRGVDGPDVRHRRPAPRPQAGVEITNCAARVSGRLPRQGSVTETAHHRTGGPLMGQDDKTANKVEEIRGEAKEKVGQATGDEALERQGERDQSKANLKQAGEKVKDAFR